MDCSTWHGCHSNIGDGSVRFTARRLLHRERLGRYSRLTNVSGSCGGGGLLRLKTLTTFGTWITVIGIALVFVLIFFVNNSYYLTMDSTSNSALEPELSIMLATCS